MLPGTMSAVPEKLTVTCSPTTSTVHFDFQPESSPRRRRPCNRGRGSGHPGYRAAYFEPAVQRNH